MSEIKNCPCGHEHKCNIKEIITDTGALEKIPSCLFGIKKVLLAADLNTYEVAGKKSLEIMEKSGINVKVCLYDTHSVLLPDESAIAFMESALDSDIGCIVGAGSGVINDICKYVSFRHNLEYMIIATAPSMDGYASSVAAMITGGMKVTYPAHTPTWIIADTEILRNAPIEMIKSGAGDIIGKLSCLNDWKLSSMITGEYFCEKIYNIVMEQAKAVSNAAEDIVRREQYAVKLLTESLINVGTAMSYAGNSRPASGSEHHLSHFYEITGLLDGKKYLPHGTDVGFSTSLTAALRDYLIADEPFNFNTVDENRRNSDINRIYGVIAPSVKQLQDETGFYAADRKDYIMNNISAIKKLLSESPREEEINKVLTKLGYDKNLFFNTYSSEQIYDSIIYAKDLKNRYSILWLLEDSGKLIPFAEKYVKLHCTR